MSNHKKQKLNCIFHNPNTEEETVKHLTKIFTEIAMLRFKEFLEENAQKEVLERDMIPTDYISI